MPPSNISSPLRSSARCSASPIPDARCWLLHCAWCRCASRDRTDADPRPSWNIVDALENAGGAAGILFVRTNQHFWQQREISAD